MENTRKYAIVLVDIHNKSGFQKLLGGSNATVDVVETLSELVELIREKIPHYIFICCAHEHPGALEKLIDLRKIVDMDRVHILIFFRLPEKEDMLKLLG